jgi:hypothetical protein
MKMKIESIIVNENFNGNPLNKRITFLRLINKYSSKEIEWKKQALNGCDKGEHQ